jgi:hypothetical protein
MYFTRGHIDKKQFDGSPMTRGIIGLKKACKSAVMARWISGNWFTLSRAALPRLDLLTRPPLALMKQKSANE